MKQQLSILGAVVIVVGLFLGFQGISKQLANVSPSSQLAQVAPTSNLVGYWNMNGNVNDSAGANTGSFSGGAWTTGKIGQAASLTGSNSISIPDNGTLQLKNAYTYAFWVNLTGNQPANSGLAVKTTNGSNPQVNIQFDGNGTNLVIQHDGGSMIQTGITANQLSGGWHHLVVTYDASRGTVNTYLDGNTTPRSSNAIAQPTTSGNGTLYIGQEETGVKLQGAIDEVRVYSKALSDQGGSSSEIAQLYNYTGVTGPTVGVVYISQVGGNLTANIASNCSTITNTSGVVTATKCTASVPVGTRITLTQSANTGYVFSKWYTQNVPETCAGTATTCTVTASVTPTNLAAYFNQSPVDTTIPALTVTSPNGGETWTKGSQQTVTWSVVPQSIADNATGYYVQFVNDPVLSVGGPILQVTPTRVSPTTFSANITVPNITAFATGQYRIKVWTSNVSYDLSDTSNASFTVSPYTQTVLPLAITSGPTITSTGSTEVNIFWATNQKTDTQVQYGTTQGYGSQTALKNLNPNGVFGHNQILSGLTPNTLYNYRVISKNASSTTVTSPNNTFTTAQLNDYTVNLAVSGNGTIAVTNTTEGVICSDTSCIVPRNSSITLRATANPGSGFVSWTNAGSCTSATCTFTPSGLPMTQTVTAVFSTTQFNPTVTLTANPTSITSGNSSTLSWTSQNATNCTASNGWTGTKTLTGTLPVSPTVTTTYTLTCTGAVGTTPASSTAVVSVGTGGTAWYVDKDAPAGGDGRSWNTAWNSMSNVVWGTNGVKAGTTLYISGGSSGTTKEYTTPWSVGASGTLGSPITIAIDAANPNHNGTAFFNFASLSSGNQATVDGISFSNRSYITFNGNVNGQKHLKIGNLYNITSERLASCMYAFGTTDTTTMTGVVIDHVEFNNCNNGARFAYLSNFTIKDSDFIGIRGDTAAEILGTGNATWDSSRIYGNNVELLTNSAMPSGQTIAYSGPDGFQIGDGVSVYNNTIKVSKTTAYTSKQHPDSIQTIGNYVKIYNNEFINIGDSGLDITANTHDVRIYNNIFRIIEANDSYPEFFRLYVGSGNAGATDIANIKIFNNTFVDNVGGWGAYPAPIRFGSFAGANPTASVEIKNNIFYNIGGGSTPLLNVDASTGFTANSFAFSNNVYYNSSGAPTITYRGTPYTIANWINPTTGIDRTGKSGQPLFQGYPPSGLGNNFQLQSGDNVAQNAGVNLSAYFTTDKAGNTRPATGAWDIGAYEYGGVAQPPVLTVTKTGSTGTGTATSSGSINCGPTCTTQTANGTAGMTVNLGINPSSGSTFGGWTITPTTTIVSGCTTTSTTCSFILNSDTTANVLFNGSTGTAPTITTQPQSQTVSVGATATFSVVASGSTPLTYQWMKNGVNITTNGTGSSYTTPATVSGDSGSTYSVKVTNSIGNVTSSNATLTVNSSGACTTTCYVRQLATAGGNGSSWSTALQSLPATFVRGTTYYVADGTYSGFSINTPASGSQYIKIVKATQNNHGSDTGWVSTYGAGQAVFGPSNLQHSQDSGFIEINGYSESVPNNTGIKFSFGNGSTGFAVEYGAGKTTNMKLTYLEFAGPASSSAYNYTSETYGINISPWNGTNYGDYTGSYIGYNSIHGSSDGLHIMGASPITIERNNIYDINSSNAAYHGNAAYLGGTAATFRYNRVWNYVPEGIHADAGSSGLQAYGNVFFDTADPSVTKGINFPAGYSHSNDKVYNNTFVGMNIGVFLRSGTYSGVEVRDNLLYGATVSQEATAGITTSNNVQAASGDFVSLVGDNYHLSKAIPGMSLASPYNNIDPDNKTRGSDGTWDVGAYEYQASIGCTGTCKYIRAGATGTATGNDWTNAYTGFGTATGQLNPSSLARGTTYYVADGTYSSLRWMRLAIPDSNNTLISIKKATDNEHGTATGWVGGVGGYGDGQAIIPDIEFGSGHWVLDGGVGSGSSRSTYGFATALVSGVQESHLSIDYGNTITLNDFTIAHVAVQCAGENTTYSQVGLWKDNQTTANDVKFRNNLVDNCRNNIQVKGQNWLIENNYFARQWSGSAASNLHGEAIDSIGYADLITFRNNIVAQCRGTTCIGNGSTSNWDIYGNIFMDADTGNGIVGAASAAAVTNAKIYNNTIINSPATILYQNNPGGSGSGNAVKNNLFINSNTTIATNGGGAIDSTTPVVATAGSFVNFAGGNYHLSLSLPGVALTSTSYNNTTRDNSKDPDGVIRGSVGGWDVGAYEFPGVVALGGKSNLALSGAPLAAAAALSSTETTWAVIGAIAILLVLALFVIHGRRKKEERGQSSDISGGNM